MCNSIFFQLLQLTVTFSALTLSQVVFEVIFHSKGVEDVVAKHIK